MLVPTVHLLTLQDQQYKVGAVLLQQEVLERVPAPGTAAPRRIMVM